MSPAAVEQALDTLQDYIAEMRYKLAVKRDEALTHEELLAAMEVWPVA